MHLKFSGIVCCDRDLSAMNSIVHYFQGSHQVKIQFWRKKIHSPQGWLFRGVILLYCKVPHILFFWRVICGISTKLTVDTGQQTVRARVTRRAMDLGGWVQNSASEPTHTQSV